MREIIFWRDFFLVRLMVCCLGVDMLCLSGGSEGSEVG